ncbi:MAG: hypothetical protein Q9209_001345 [Squamulea sp. 1 TL-2023]
MDPVSIAASTIAFIHACRKLAAGFRFLNDVSQAPKDILTLTDELDDLQNTLAAVGLITRKRQDDITNSLLMPLLHEVNRIIHEFCHLCGACPQKLKEDDGYGEQLKLHLLARFKWTLAKKRVNELRERLKVVRLDLSNSLAATSLLDISHLTDEVRTLSDRLAHTTFLEAQPQLENPPLYEATSMIVTAQTRSRYWDVEAQDRGLPIVEKGPPLQIQPTRSDDSMSGLCKRACSCACHSVCRVKSPTILQSFIESLLVKHNGLYGLNQACNERSCRRSTSAHVKISYQFPEWLFNRVVSSVLLSNRVDGPRLTLVIPRVVSNTSDIFFHAFSGNIDAIAKLFQAGLASPCDISGMWGYSALHYALDRGHLDLCRFLLKAGARPEITDIEERSVTDMAWNKICLKKVSNSEVEQLEEIFKKDDWFEERQFTPIHKIVLDLVPSSRNLEGELFMSTKDINTTDAEGRTPLSWAAELGNLPANDETFVNALLDHGADINERDYYGSTALSGAVFMNQFHSARCLLERGASTGTYNLNVMNDAIENNSHECIALLLEYNANLSTANIHGETSLHVLARRGDLRSIESFQTAGIKDVDPEAKTKERFTVWDVMRQRADVTGEVEIAFRGLMAKLQPETKYVQYFDAEEKMPTVAGKVSDSVQVRVEEVLVD